MIVVPTVFYHFQEGDFDLSMANMSPVTLCENGEARTIIIDGEVAMILGVSMSWEGCGEVWSFPTDLIQGHGIAVVREARKLRDAAMKKFNLRQLRALISERSMADMKWITFCGFEYEAVLVGACPDASDLLVYKYERRH